MVQLSMWAGRSPAPWPSERGGQTIDQRFAAFHYQNPQVFRLFERYTLDLIAAGAERGGAKSVIERIRWDVAVSTWGEKWKVNNDYTACYARLFHMTYPEYAGFFRLRKRPSTAEPERVR